MNHRASEIGKLLRRARERTRRSQAEVAESAAISPSMLSQIEHGHVSPSIDTLCGVCAALDLEVAELFRKLSPAQPIRLVRSTHRLRTERGGIRYEQLVSSASASHPAEMLLLELERGCQVGVSGRGHEGVELGSVLAGSAVLTVDGVAHPIREGDSVSFGAMSEHRLENTGRGVFRAIWTVLPPHQDYLESSIDKAEEEERQE